MAKSSKNNFPAGYCRKLYGNLISGYLNTITEPVTGGNLISGVFPAISVSFLLYSIIYYYIVLYFITVLCITVFDQSLRSFRTIVR